MSAPKPILKGIDDKSRQLVPYEDLPYAQHTPLLMLMTKRGPVNPILIGIDGFDVFYDLMSLGENSPWHSHQSELARIAIEEANSSIIVKRIVDEYSKTAGVCIGKDPVRQRVKCMELEVHSSPYHPNEFLPILEFEMADPGDWGNYVGMEIYRAPDKIQASIGRALDCVIYEAKVYIEDQQTGSRRLHPNKYGDMSTYFTFKRDSMYNSRDLFFDVVMADAYIEDSPSVTRRQNFSRFKVYTEHLEDVAGKEDYWKHDILSDIKPYQGSGFKPGLPFFGIGGSDGFPDISDSTIENRLNRQRIYDEQVRNWLNSIDETNEILDMAKYPLSTIWDSGYTKQTKEAINSFLRHRKDIWVAGAVFSQYRYLDQNGKLYFDYQPELNTPELMSLSLHYRSLFGSIPESANLGTPTVRATLVMQDGINTKSRYQKRQTLNADLFRKICRYCGSASKKWKPDAAFDVEPMNELVGWEGVNGVYLPKSIMEDAWNAGLIYAQNKDDTKQFYPMFQTLYPDDTSVLNSIFTMMACCWIQKLHHRAWTLVSGNTKNTEEELALMMDNYINENLMDAFENRFIVTSKTVVTPADKLLGFSFTTETTIYSTMTKHTATYKLTAHRMSDAVDKE